MSDSAITWLGQIRGYFTSMAPRPRGPATRQPRRPRRLGLALGSPGRQGRRPPWRAPGARAGSPDRPDRGQLGGRRGGGALRGRPEPSAGHREVFHCWPCCIAVPDPTRTALIGQRRREEILRLLLGERTFADLRLLPCAVMTTDLVSGRPVLVDEAWSSPAGHHGPAADLPARGPRRDGPRRRQHPQQSAGRCGPGRSGRGVIAVELNDAVPRLQPADPSADTPLARLMLAPAAVQRRRQGPLAADRHATALHLRDNARPAGQPYVADISTLDFSNPEKGHEAGLMARDMAAELLALRAWRLEEPAPPLRPAPAPSPPAPGSACPSSCPAGRGARGRRRRPARPASSRPSQRPPGYARAQP